MSVLILNVQEVFDCYNTLSAEKEVIEFVSKSESYKRYLKYSPKVTIKEYLGFVFRSAIISNHVAHSVQYSETFDMKKVNQRIENATEKNVNLESAIDTLGSLIYNIRTNSGTVYLQDDRHLLLIEISELKIEKEVIVKVEKQNNPNIKKADRRKTTSLLKKYYKEKFGMTVKITSDVFSMGSSIHLNYTNGVQSEKLNETFRKLQYGHFDGMTDSYTIDKDNSGLELYGYQLNDYKYSSITRTYTKNLVFQAAKMISKTINVAGMEIVKEYDDINKNFKHTFNGCWTWSELTKRYLRNCNFKSNKDDITLVSCRFEDQKFEFTYKLEGKKDIYSTKEIETAVIIDKCKTTKDVKMIDYSDKAIAVIGDTYELRGNLRKIGGRFNRGLTVDGEKVPGWIFSKKKESRVSDLLIKYMEA